MSDPLNEALKEATLAVLLGSTSVNQTTVDPQGYAHVGTVTIESAFVQRIRSKAFEGAFDDILHKAIEKIEVEAVAKALENILADQFVEGLKKSHGWNHSPGWFENHTKALAVEAASKAIRDDEDFMDILRTKIGMELDRNKINVSLNLSDPEA